MTGYEPVALPLSYGPLRQRAVHGKPSVARKVASIYPASYTPRVRWFHLLVVASLVAPAARADLIDLSEGSRRPGKPPALVLRFEAGNDFAPYGYVGGCLSYLTESLFEIEAGAGGGFPGLQLGLAARRLFGERGSYVVTELALAGNTRVNRGSDADPLLNLEARQSRSSFWTSLGLGFEQRQGSFDLSVVGALALTTASLTPHFAIHGGVGFGF